MATNYMKYMLGLGQSMVRHNLRKWRRREKIAENRTPDIEKHLRNIRKNGYSVVEGFFSPQQCADLRMRVDTAFEKFPDATWSGVRGADKRIFGIEHLGGDFARFYDDDCGRDVGSRYFGGQLGNLQTLVGRIDAVEGNIGSGEGWHRDGRHFQFKSLVYLSDVAIDNGPFQLIRDSHRFGQIIADDHKMGLEDPDSTRITEQQVDLLLKDNPERLITLTASAGTMVLVDTSAIHRGSPIRAGRRYAMFNYYYPTYDLAGRREKFQPRLSPEMVQTAA